MKQSKEQRSLLPSFLKKKGVLPLVVLFLFGLLLLLFSGKSAGQEEKATVDFDEEAYTSELEKRTEELIGHVKGAGDAQVMLTVDCIEQRRFAADITVEEEEHESVSRTVYRETPVFETDRSGTKSPVVESMYLPKVRGVSVVCTGGADAGVRLKIISLLQALYGLKSHQISVTD